MDIETQIKKLVSEAKKDASNIRNFSAGELAMALVQRLTTGTQIRVTAKGVRVTHSRYIDRLRDAADIDEAIQLGA